MESIYFKQLSLSCDVIYEPLNLVTAYYVTYLKRFQQQDEAIKRTLV